LVYFAGQTDKVCFNRDYEGIVTNGLVLNVDAGFTPSYSRSGTTWYDVSSIGNNGTLTNGPTFNSDNGGSIVFDGVDDFVDLPHLINVSNPITWNIWFKTISTNGALLSDWYSQPFSFLFRILDGQFALGLRNSNRVDISDASVGRFTLTSNIIYNICVTYSQTVGGLNIYSNGVLITQTGNNVSPPNIFNTSNNFSIGVKQDTLTYLNGSVYMANIYNRALTAQEVLQNYNALKGRFGL
jgi:hypothetical protein